MPELPEVETTLRGIQPHIQDQLIHKIIVRHPRLRWPIPSDLEKILPGHKVKNIQRRGKYLLLSIANGTLIIHLGMSGSLRIVDHSVTTKKHDHVDIEFANHKILRFTDPRRFGAYLWTEEDVMQHPLLKHLGPEPFSREFSGTYLLQKAQRKNLAVKSFIMDSKIVVGVGNIYATEALFLANIHPMASVKSISVAQFHNLAKAIKTILRQAIKQGGTTLKDFVNSDGKPGYFIQKLKVYGRSGLNCVRCHSKLEFIRQSQRSTVFCPSCQKKASTRKSGRKHKDL